MSTSQEVDNLRSETMANRKLLLCGSDRGNLANVNVLSPSFYMLIQLFSLFSVNSGHFEYSATINLDFRE